MDIKGVEKLAELARIELQDEEKESMLHDMKGILEYVKQIENLKIEDQKADYDLYNVWREDTSINTDYSKELLIKQFPDSQDGFLKVKKIL